MKKLILSALLMIPALAQADIPRPGPARPTHMSSQQYIAKQLKAQAVKGGALEGVLKSSIKPSNIKIFGSLNGPVGPDHGPSAKFTITGLEKRVPGRSGQSTLEKLSASGVDVTNSFMGPYVRIDKVTPVSAP